MQQARVEFFAVAVNLPEKLVKGNRIYSSTTQIDLVWCFLLIYLKILPWRRFKKT